MLLRLNTIIRRFVLVVAAAPLPGLAQSSDDVAARQRALVARIDEIQAAHGPQSLELIEPLNALALVFEENGDEVFAIATTERVLQLMRTNFGLYSLEQVPTLSRVMESAETRGDHALAWQHEQTLLDIARRSPEDLRTVAILRDIADRRIDILERYINGEFPPQIVLGCFYSLNRIVAPHGCEAGRKGVAAAALLEEAHSNYNQAIDTLVLHELYSSDELEAFEMDLVRTSYMYGRYLSGSTACHRAIESLNRLNSYDELNDEPLVVRTQSLVRAADFRLYCGWNASALNGYRAALDMLVEAAVPQSQIDRIFAPDKPVELPALVEGILDVKASDVFVEVAFELTRFGMTRNVEVISGGEHAGAGTVESRIRKGRFRPFARDGEIVDSPRLIVRYYLSE